MFSVITLSLSRLWPRLGVADILRRCLLMHQNNIDMEEMPESWQRDVGMLDGRGRRGPPNDGAMRAARMIYTQRNL